MGEVDVYLILLSTTIWGKPTRYSAYSRNRNSIPGRDKVYAVSTSRLALGLTVMGPRDPFTEGTANTLSPSGSQLRRSQWPCGLRRNSLQLPEYWGVSLDLFCISVVLCAGIGLATAWFPIQGSYRLCIRSRNWKSGQGPTMGCRTIEK
jgi:hypothetical protein